MVSSVRHGSDRFKQDLIGRPIWERVFKEVWGQYARARWVKEGGLLDKEFGVDVQIHRPTLPFVLHGQVKSLGYYYGTTREYDTITVEYYQNPHTEEKGDAFKLNVQFYACAYLNKAETDFTHGGIVDWYKLIEATYNGLLWAIQGNTKSNARASFIHVRYNSIPSDCFIWRKKPE